MLSELRVEGLGVIADVSLVLGRGMTALTGETGAGKTMLVEAIALLVGERADGGLVRPGAAEAKVEGRFVVGDDEVVLARVIPADGRSRAYVDGRLATVAQIAEAGGRLVDLHGQHAHQSLLNSAVQRAALDRFGAVDLEPLRVVRARRHQIEAALLELGGDARARAREVDLLRFQVEEIRAAALGSPSEDEELEVEEDRLAGVQSHREAAERSLGALVDEGGALDGLRRALAGVDRRSPFTELADRLRGLAAELDDAAVDLRSVGEGLEEDPQRLAALRARRQLLHELRRKYGDTLADVSAYGEEAAERLAELDGWEARAAALDVERRSALAEEAATARVVATARRAAAPRLAEAVRANLATLAMPRARVEVTVGGDDPADDVVFLLGANPGEPLAPLAKVASGGELARAMLALRLVLTEAPDTLVFDEVDAGIGGEAALAVGRSLAELAHRHQVLVVTHLAQVAAFADTQVAVGKEEVSGRTIARATRLSGESRTRELSRMLSGLADSEPARRHAEELLDAAGSLRTERSGHGSLEAAPEGLAPRAGGDGVRIDISDPDDPRVGDYLGLRDHQLRMRRERPGGDRAHLFVAEGDLVVDRALRAGHHLKSLLVDAARTAPLPPSVPDAVPLYVAGPRVLQRITGYHLHRGVLAVFHRAEERTAGEVLAGATSVVVLENVVNPTNLGVIIRSAAALGIDAVLMDPTCADPLYRRASRVAMGEVFALPWARLTPFPEGLGTVRDAGFTLLALTPAPDAVPLDALRLPGGCRPALVLGSEGPGLPDHTISAADLRVRIPMSRGVDSLNVGAAAAVAMWAVLHPARDHTPPDGPGS